MHSRRVWTRYLRGGLGWRTTVIAHAARVHLSLKARHQTLMTTRLEMVVSLIDTVGCESLFGVVSRQRESCWLAATGTVPDVSVSTI